MNAMEDSCIAYLSMHISFCSSFVSAHVLNKNELIEKQAVSGRGTETKAKPGFDVSRRPARSPKLGSTDRASVINKMI